VRELRSGRHALADPITLDIPDHLAERLSVGAVLALRDAEGVMLAALHVEDLWCPDREERPRRVRDRAA